jgi:Ca-activated chloride channel family protein
MKITTRVDRPVFGPSGGTRYLWVRLEAPSSPSNPSRTPLDIALVLDRSGSMSGRKIALTQRAASRVVGVLGDSDRCSLVDYDQEVTRTVSCARTDAGHRERLRAAISSLYARGSTDLFGGWLAGAEEISDTADGRVKRVLLLTDGLANAGLTDHAQILHHVRELALRGVATSTFGVGADFDEHLVAGMAEAGSGHFHFIERAEQIPDILQSELGELQTVVARRVRLLVAVGGAVRVHCLNDLPMDGSALDVGDMSAGEVVDLCFAVEVAPGREAPMAVGVALEWVDATSNEACATNSRVEMVPVPDIEAAQAPADRDVVGQIVRVAAAAARDEALAFNSSGAFGDARSRIEKAVGFLELLRRDYPEAAAEIDALRLSQDMVSGPMAASAAKSMKFAAYQTRRSRPVS